MGKKLFAFIAVCCGLTLTIPFVGYSASFYEGQVVRIIVSYSPGGGFDTYARAIARHMGKHIPGNPSVIVENMPGAGGLIATNYTYKVAKPDGLTIGNFIGTHIMGQLLGREGVEFDVRKFEWIGIPALETVVAAFTKASGITSMEKLVSSKTPVKVGGTSFGDINCDAPKILSKTLGLPLKVVEGYKGTAQIRLAAETGEVAGLFNEWESIKTTWRSALDKGDIVVVMQLTGKAHPDLANVPRDIDFAKTQEAKELIQVGIHSLASMVRLYALPPGTPRERVQILRKAFQETMKDKEFLAEAQKAKLDIHPGSAEMIEEAIGRIFNLKPGTVAELREMIYPKK